MQELELDKFITHEVEFKDINKAFDYMLKGEEGKGRVGKRRGEEMKGTELYFPFNPSKLLKRKSSFPFFPLSPFPLIQT
ncbi:Alcohol dehydrogenase 1 [Bienertia sinuspersici]